MKIFLDDKRTPPKGWVLRRWPQEVIWEMKHLGSKVEAISLDHDLGNDYIGTGMTVLNWLEERVANDPSFHVPEISLHTANPPARERMSLVIASINRFKPHGFQP